MKTIFIVSHEISNQGLKAKILKNGDIYDSQIEVWENGVQLWKGVCNVDSTSTMKTKIEIVNGIHYGIIGKHKNKYKAILIINKIPQIQNWLMIKEEDRIIDTIQINPKWGTKKAKFINIHMGGDSWDWSEGCITIHKNDYDKFIELFEINEIVSIEKV